MQCETGCLQCKQSAKILTGNESQTARTRSFDDLELSLRTVLRNNTLSSTEPHCGTLHSV